MALRHTQHRFHKLQGEPELPALTLVAPDADEYTRDHEARHTRKGFSSSPPPVDAVTTVATNIRHSPTVQGRTWRVC
jgi:hypothetical protein